MTNSIHTSSAFENDLSHLNEMIGDLGGLARKQLRSSIKALSDYRISKIDKLIKRDEKLDRLESEIVEKAMEIIAIRSPRAGDLRRVIVAANAATILERVGDYSRNTGNRIKTIMAMQNEGLPFDQLHAMGSLVAEMLSDVLEAHRTSNVELALQIRESDVNVDEMNTEIYRNVIALMQSQTELVPAGVHTLFIAKNYERMGDYATSIAEQVHYMATSEMPESFRPKADLTSWLLDEV